MIPPVVFDSHPPERRRRRGTTLALSCCCSCCLHSLGGLIGAAIGSIQDPSSLPSMPIHLEKEEGAPSPRPRGSEIKVVDTKTHSGRPATSLCSEEDEDHLAPTRPIQLGSSVVVQFWQMVLVLSAVGSVVSCSGIVIGGPFLSTVMILALYFPLVQLLSAVIVATALGLSGRPDRAYQFKRLGKVLLGAFLCASIGFFLFFAMFGLEPFLWFPLFQLR